MLYGGEFKGQNGNRLLYERDKKYSTGGNGITVINNEISYTMYIDIYNDVYVDNNTKKKKKKKKKKNKKLINPFIKL